MRSTKSLSHADGSLISDWARFRNDLAGGQRGADYILKTLFRDGVSVLFGLPADSINALFDAARKLAGLRVITCHHEATGALMASAYGKISGTPAVMTATNGPGVGHLPVGARDAYLDEAPLILLPGTVPHSTAGMRGFQDLNGQKLLEPWSDGVFRCESASGLDRIKVVVPRSKQCKRPVAFIAAPDVLMNPYSAGVKQASTFSPAEQWSSRRGSVRQANAMIDKSVNCVILLGDCRNSPAVISEEVHARAYSSLSSMQGPGWGDIPSSRRLLPDATRFPWSADGSAVIVVGDWPGELEDQLASTTVIHITTTPSWRVETNKYVNLCGKVGAEFLTANVNRAKAQFAPTDSVRPFCDVIPVLDQICGYTDLVSCEPGAVLAGVFNSLEARSRTFTSSFAAATRGYGIAGAIAGSILDNTRLNIAVVDERGWTESHIEVATAMKHGCNIAVVYLASSEDEVRLRCSEGHALGLSVRVVEAQEEPVALRTYEMVVLKSQHSSQEVPNEPHSFGSLQWQLGGASHVCAEPQSQESFAMQAVGASKTLGEVSTIDVYDECTLLRILNALADASMDSAAVVVVAHEAEWRMEADRLLPDLAHSSFSGSPAEREALVEMAKVASATSRTLSLVQIQPGATRIRVGERSHRTQFSSQLALPESGSLERCKAALLDSQNPIILVGGGARDTEGIASISAALGAPIVATMAGAIFDTLPNFAGYVGSSGQKHSNKALRDADVVLMLGISNRGAAFDLVSGDKTVVDVNNDLETLISRKFDSLGVHSDSSTFIAALLNSGLPTQGSGSQISCTHRMWWDDAAQKPTLAGKLRPSFVVRKLDENLPAELGFAFTGDVGINTLWLFRYRKHHSSTVWSRNFATMGFGLPAALARAKLTGRPTVAVVGDGGMGMSMGAITTDCDSPVLCVVLNNRGLAAIRYEQEILGWPEFESGFTNPDFAAFARSRSWDGRKVTTEQELRGALNDFIASPSPMLLDVVCTADEPPIPALTPKPVRVASALFAWARQGRKGLVSASTALKAIFASR